MRKTAGGRHGSTRERNMAGRLVRHPRLGRRLPARHGKVPQLDHRRRIARTYRRGRLPGRGGPLSSLRLLRLPLGAPDTDLPRAEGSGAPHRRLGRASRHAGGRLDLPHRLSGNHRRPAVRGAVVARCLSPRPARCVGPRHRAGPVGQGEGDHRLERKRRDHPHVQRGLRRPDRQSRRLLAPAAASADRGAERPHLRDRQQRRLPRRLRDAAGAL